MFEKQMESLRGLNSRASQAIVKYYSELDKDKIDRLDNLESALAQIDILIMYIIQFRSEVRAELDTMPGSQKQSAYDALEELRTIQDAAKTVSYNLTAVVHSIRDLYKVENL